MNQPPNMVQRYAYLMAGVEYSAARGEQPPEHVLHELNQLHAKAQAVLNPQEQALAMSAADSMKAEFLQQRAAQDAQTMARDRGFYADQLSRGLTGLSPDQLGAAKAGEKFPIKGRGHDLPKVKANIEGILKGAGQDMSFAEFDRISDRVEEITLHGRDPKQYLEKKFGDKADQVHDLIDSYQSSGVSLSVGLAELRPGEGDHYVKPTEELQRKSEIADAWARSAAKDPNELKNLASGIDPAYTDPDNDTMQGDIARIFEAAEAVEATQERESYSPAEYAVEDSDEEIGYAAL
jgi:hypothetical protein